MATKQFILNSKFIHINANAKPTTGVIVMYFQDYKECLKIKYLKNDDYINNNHKITRWKGMHFILRNHIAIIGKNFKKFEK